MLAQPMKPLITLAFLILISQVGITQDLSGKWYGKLTQLDGGYSTLYDVELQLVHKNIIRGESHAFFESEVSTRIGLKGTLSADSVNLSESIFMVREDRMPDPWVACIKNYKLKYYKQNGNEYLKGSWDGTGVDDGKACIPGEVILSKSKRALDEFIQNDGFQRPFLKDIPDSTFLALTKPPLPEFTPQFQNTVINPIKEITVRNKTLTLRISDYRNVDNDTVSVYFNREVIADHQRISKRQIRLDLTLNDDLVLNELILFAENLGSIPPNTSQLLIRDGSITHRLVIESDKQKTAAIYLKYMPD